MTFGNQIPTGQGALEWSCHVCGKVRPDADVGVVSRTRELLPGTSMQENLRYCNVDVACMNAAMEWSVAGRTAGSLREPLP